MARRVPRGFELGKLLARAEELEAVVRLAASAPRDADLALGRATSRLIQVFASLYPRAPLEPVVRERSVRWNERGVALVGSTRRRWMVVRRHDAASADEWTRQNERPLRRTTPRGAVLRHWIRMIGQMDETRQLLRREARRMESAEHRLVRLFWRKTS